MKAPKAEKVYPDYIEAYRQDLISGKAAAGKWVLLLY